MTCDWRDICPFYDLYLGEPSMREHLNGFVCMFCDGDRANQCKRREVAETLGLEHVPIDMAPTGYPMPVMRRAPWSEDVCAVVRG